MLSESSSRSGRRYSESERAEYLARQESSGLSVAEFCRRENIGVASFHGWKKRARSASFTEIVAHDAALLRGVPCVVETSKGFSCRVFSSFATPSTFLRVVAGARARRSEAVGEAELRPRARDDTQEGAALSVTRAAGAEAPHAV
jgi:hypothetical protein